MRLTAIALGLAAALYALPAPAQQSFYIDGSTPVDPNTRANVDAYMIYQEQLAHEEAERRRQFQEFIYQERDEIQDFSPPFGRY